MPFDEEVTDYYGYLRSDLEKKGTTIGALDMMIATHAQCLGTTLITNNTKDFIRVHNPNQ